MLLAEAEWTGDRRMIGLLTCPECGRITFAGGDRRRDAVFPGKFFCSVSAPSVVAMSASLSAAAAVGSRDRLRTRKIT
ncbi:hypothetical protein ACWDE9_13725 [Streptomyces olivaceoviridis]